jgi:two-component system nitrate/nitrite sensor histidine kinase NarX
MKRWLGKLPLFPDGVDRTTILKALVILSPALFILLLELLRLTVFQETSIMIWGTIAFVAILIGALLFSRLIYIYINHFQQENLNRMRELTILSEVSQTVDEYHNLNALVNKALDKFIDIANADFGELYLVDEQSHELLHKIHRGHLKDGFNPSLLLDLREWILSTDIRLDQHVIITNPMNFQGRPIASLVTAGVRSLAVVPLKSMSDTVGIACLFSLKRNNFELNKKGLFFNIGNRIAMAIERARLYEKVQALAVLEERERISSELHDGLAQVLSYVITKSQATRQLLQKLTEANDFLGEIENVAQELYTDTREAIVGLRTAISGDRNMVSAIRDYVERFKQMHNIKTEFVITDLIIPSLSPQVELQAIRIVQEALSNIRKHAEATHAVISITKGDDAIIISVKDDGKGFDADILHNEDFTKIGLQNMKERANRIHSGLLIESSPQNGTEVTLRIPTNSFQISTEESREIENFNS